jgi:hypothetical protein
MAKDWRCRLSFHRYKRKRNDDGEVYQECTRCGNVKLTTPASDIAASGANAPWGG